MTDQEELPHWRPGAVDPAKERELEAQYRAFTETREVPHLQGGNVPGVTSESGSRSRLPIVAGLLLVCAASAALVSVGYFLATRSTSSPSAEGATLQAQRADTELLADSEGAEDPAGAVAVEDDETAQGETVEGQSDEGQSGEDADAQDEDAEEAQAGESTDAPVRWALISQGKLYLRGAVPDQATADAIVQKAAAVIGPDNVIVEYEIDPATIDSVGNAAPLYVEDVVLFEFNSSEIAKPFYPLLDMGVLLLRQNPQASITVITHTDAVGSEDTNLEVSRRRADAVANYWLAQGVQPTQIRTDARGEAEAVETDDPTEAQAQRRAEFFIAGLLE